MGKKRFVGFGFGPIQSGLFLYEASRSGNFERLTVSEVDREVIEAVRANGNAYTVNIARPDGIVQERVEGVELYFPGEMEDHNRLVQAIAHADELATALPSVQLFEDAVGPLLASGFVARQNDAPKIVYAAENNNDAAALLKAAVRKHAPASACENVQFLDTVVGKMSGTIHDKHTIDRLGLATMTPSIGRAILVEEFNRILVGRVTLPNATRGIEVFEEKRDLMPFEEAKLYGHNAIHATLAYLLAFSGAETVAEASEYPALMRTARRAFLDECGAALVRKHASIGDPLFTEDGFKAFADDLLERMVNPNLNDLVARVGRDPLRKLGWKDRLTGTMRVCLDHGVEPKLLAVGAAAAVQWALQQDDKGNIELPVRLRPLSAEEIAPVLKKAWKGQDSSPHADEIVRMVHAATEQLERFLPGRAAE